MWQPEPSVDESSRRAVGTAYGEELLTRLTAAAVAGVPGADYAGLTMHEHGKLVSRAPSHPQIGDIDQLQISFDEGPCLDAAARGTSVSILVEDFATEPRWPLFAPAAAGHGIRSLLSFTMTPSAAARGALNLYSTRPRAFDAESRATAAAFAQQAAITIHGAETIAGLERALQRRDLIGQAKGILMERFGIDGPQAFDRLVRSSQETNIKLFDVAQWLVDETTTRGTDPDTPTT